MRAEIRRLALVAGLAALVAGCAGGTSALDGALPVALRVSTTPTTVEVDAPGWLANVSEVYLCPDPPPPLPDANADRKGWTPGDACHDFGRHPSRDGLTVSLPIADLSGPQWAAFEAATDWYLLVLDLDGDVVASAVRSRFHAPPVTAPS
jgi:hypothetical protein